MKKLIAIALVFACLGSASAQDSWTGPDKKKHFAVSLVAGYLARGVFTEMTDTQAFALALVPGVVKEVSDIGTTGFSGKDLVWDAIGAATGVYLGGFVIGHRSIGFQTKF